MILKRLVVAFQVTSQTRLKYTVDNIFTGTDLNVKFAGKCIIEICNREGGNALYDHAIQRVLKYWNYIMNFNFTQSGTSMIRTYK